MTDETLDNSHRLATTNISIDIGTIVSEKPRPPSLIPLIEICNTVNFYLILCNNTVSITHSYLPFLSSCFIHDFVGSDPQVVTILQNGPQVKSSWTTLL